MAASGSGDPENANGPATAGGVGEGLGDDSLLPDDPRFSGGGGLINTRRENPVLKGLRIAIPLLALAALILTFLWLRGLRGLSPTGQFYARMTRSGGLAGVRPPPGTTPYEYAREVSRAVPGTRRSLDQIAGLYVREQYGGETPTVQEVRLVRRAWLTFRAALLRSIVSFRRHRAGGEEFD